MDKTIMPAGLYYVDNAIGEIYNELVQHLATTNEWFSVGSSKNSRKVIHYGYKYNYSGGNGAPTTPFPECIMSLQASLISSLDEILPNHNEKFDQCIINKYEPGQGIGAHIDSRDYGAVVGCFTIGGPAAMEFISPEGITYQVVTADQSLYIMTGDARYLWKHQLAAKKSDYIEGKSVPRGVRTSITFRSVNF